MMVDLIDSTTGKDINLIQAMVEANIAKIRSHSGKTPTSSAASSARSGVLSPYLPG